MCLILDKVLLGTVNKVFNFVWVKVSINIFWGHLWAGGIKGRYVGSIGHENRGKEGSHVCCAAELRMRKDLGKQKERRRSTDSLTGFLEHMPYGLAGGACKILGVG